MSLPMWFAGFNNFVPSTMETNAGEKVTGTHGLVSWAVDNTDKSVQYEFDHQQQDSYTMTSTYSPVYNIPIITISGSAVEDTGNTSYANPISLTPSVSQSASASHADSDSQGVNLTEIIVPVAGIAGVAALAYAIFGGKK